MSISFRLWFWEIESTALCINKQFKKKTNKSKSSAKNTRYSQTTRNIGHDLVQVAVNVFFLVQRNFQLFVLIRVRSTRKICTNSNAITYVIKLHCPICLSHKRINCLSYTQEQSRNLSIEKKWTDQKTLRKRRRIVVIFLLAAIKIVIVNVNVRMREYEVYFFSFIQTKQHARHTRIIYNFLYDLFFLNSLQNRNAMPQCLMYRNSKHQIFDFLSNQTPTIRDHVILFFRDEITRNQQFYSLNCFRTEKLLRWTSTFFVEKEKKMARKLRCNAY